MSASLYLRINTWLQKGAGLPQAPPRVPCRLADPPRESQLLPAGCCVTYRLEMETQHPLCCRGWESGAEPVPLQGDTSLLVPRLGLGQGRVQLQKEVQPAWERHAL